MTDALTKLLQSLNADQAELVTKIIQESQKNEKIPGTPGTDPHAVGVVEEVNIQNPELPDDFVDPKVIAEEVAKREPLPRLRPEPFVGQCTRRGNYRITWTNLDGGHMYLDLKPSIHAESPMISTMVPYVGPLCEHELQFFRSIPGDEHSIYWLFTVEENVEE